MLSNVSLAIASIINLLLVPAIGFKVLKKRNVEIDVNVVERFEWYLLIVVLNYPCTHIVTSFLRNKYGIDIYTESSKYTIISLISCLILVYVIEFFYKYVNIKVKISKRNVKEVNSKDEK